MDTVICECGRECEGYYARYQGECARCEDMREGEVYAFYPYQDEKPRLTCSGIGVNYSVMSDGRIRFD